MAVRKLKEHAERVVPSAHLGLNEKTREAGMDVPDPRLQGFCTFVVVLDLLDPRRLDVPTKYSLHLGESGPETGVVLCGIRGQVLANIPYELLIPFTRGALARQEASWRPDLNPVLDLRIALWDRRGHWVDVLTGYSLRMGETALFLCNDHGRRFAGVPYQSWFAFIERAIARHNLRDDEPVHHEAVCIFTEKDRDFLNSIGVGEAA